MVDSDISEDYLGVIALQHEQWTDYLTPFRALLYKEGSSFARSATSAALDVKGKG